MDGERFDAWTRRLSAGASRRRVLRGLAAGAVGAVAGALGLRRAGAQGGCSAYGRVCTFSGCCRDGAECRCYANGHCRCLCPEGTEYSNGACVGVCPPGDVVTADPAACTCTQGSVCEPAFFPRCGGDPTCACGTTADGGLACFDSLIPCGRACSAADPCEPGFACVVNTCCGEPACLTLCGGAVGHP